MVGANQNGRLAEVGPRPERLHLLVGESVSIVHHRHRIAVHKAIGEYVDLGAAEHLKSIARLAY